MSSNIVDMSVNMNNCRMLLVHALDDPLIPVECMVQVVDTDLAKRYEHKAIMCLTEVGGHLGWTRSNLADGRNWKFIHDVFFTFVDACSTYEEKED